MPFPKDSREIRLQEALKAHAADTTVSVRKLSIQFEVPKSTLQNLISQKTTPAKTANEWQQLLSNTEKEALSSWIKKWDDYGFSTRRRHVFQIVQSLLRARNSTDQVGEH